MNKRMRTNKLILHECVLYFSAAFTIVIAQSFDIRHKSGKNRIRLPNGDFFLTFEQVEGDAYRKQ